MADRQRPDRASGRRPGRPTAHTTTRAATRAARTADGSVARSARSTRRTTGARPVAGASTGSTALSASAQRRSPRLTGRSAILVLLLAVLAVSYASSAKAYLNQRSHISSLKAEIATRSASIESLQAEQKRWHDPAFLEREARQRFQFVLPGETSFQVLTPSGQPLDDQDRLHSASSVVKTVPTAWYSTAWGSMELAGASTAAK